MANKIAMLSKIARRANEGAEAVGEAGKSVMHGEVDASPSLISKLNAMRDTLAPIDARAKQAAEEQAQQAFINRVGSMRGMFEAARNKTTAAAEEVTKNAETSAGPIFYGTPNGPAAVGEDAAKQWAREDRVAKAHARHVSNDAPGVLYAGTSGPAMSQAQMIDNARAQIRGISNFGKGTRALGSDGAPITMLEAGYNAVRDGDAATAKSIARHNNKVDGMKNEGYDPVAYSQHYETANRVRNNIRESQAARAAIAKGSPMPGRGGGFSAFEHAQEIEKDRFDSDIHGRLHEALGISKKEYQAMSAEDKADIIQRARKGKRAFDSEMIKSGKMRSLDTSFNEWFYKPGTEEIALSHKLDKMGVTSDERDKYYKELRDRIYAKPATSVMDSPAANTRLDTGSEFGGGIGKDAADNAANQFGTGGFQNMLQNAKKEAAPKLESNREVPQDIAGFGGGAGSDSMNSFFEDKLNTKGLSNADRHKYERVRDSYHDYMAEKGELEAGDVEGLSKLNDKYGIKADSDPAAHFRQQANSDATTMDWVYGNHIPQYAAGTMLLSGAVASCFSNKGKMSNSELYGDNF